jgi:GNAT superfamily N-acetyltransferase
MLITRAVPEDAAELTRIAHAAKRHWGYPEEWIARWAAGLTVTPDFIMAQPTVVARLERDVVGFAALTGLGRQLRLEHLWVLPAFMGRGAGRALFQEVGRLGRAAGWSSLQIVSDPNAEGFYLRLGARRIGEAISDPEGHGGALPVLLVNLPPTG